MSTHRRREATALSAARERSGLSQAKIAERLGISQPWYCVIESGQTTPRVDLAQRIADLLGVSVADLWPVSPENDNAGVQS